ncbi:hypothetical protein F2Q69_00007835 [Brassica cretica]|uniref:Uncharacterized protein n=1 Tax=Brassica cretica TaxID=69181 RepID=A0A8S9NV72_BRACR|nr:hypothetical protein F2Q69_00007835 [Brassica cretica]
MVVSKIVDLLDSSETGDDLVIPDMMFTQGKEPVGVSMALSQSSSSVSSHPIDATAEPAHRPAEEEIDLSTMQNSVYSNREKMLRQFFLISWGGCIATTAIILYSLKPYI